MRLTLIIPELQCGGAQRVMTILANGWVANGKHVTLLTLDDGSKPPFFDLDGKVRHFRLAGGDAWTNWVERCTSGMKRLMALRRMIRHSRPDAVISFLDFTNVITLVATRGLGLPVIVSERTDPNMNPVGFLLKWLRRLTYPLADCIVVLNKDVPAYFSKRLQSRISVLPNPVLRPPMSTHEPEVDPGRLSIVSMGRLEHEKGFDVLLRSFATLSDKFPEWNLVILGEGSLRHDLEALRHELGVSARVAMPGVVKNPHAVLTRADMFVMSPRFEGFGNATCEAMACGLPVISTCPSGPKSIITDGIDGLLVPCEDVAALATAMERLMNDTGEREKLARHARDVTGRFSLDKIMSMWERVLSDVVCQRMQPMKG